MRKVTIFTVVLLACFLVIGAGQVAAEDVEGHIITTDEVSNKVGFDFPTYGWPLSNDAGEITGWHGVNIGIGYSRVMHFDPLEVEELNPFWEFGTVVGIIPYVGIGAEFPFQLDEEEYLSVSGGVGLYGVRLGLAYIW